MKYVVLAVRDSAMDAFLRPMFGPSVGVVVRSFVDEVNRAAEDNAMHKHAGDYVLYQLGEWDDETGRFEMFEEAKQVSRGVDVLVKGA